jgi:glutathione-regulated potassium-efflux system ancillary protein KefC
LAPWRCRCSSVAAAGGHRRLLPPYAKDETSSEEVSSRRKAPVTINCFGRYGQIVGHICAQGISATVLDHDADMIETIRTFGYQRVLR